MTAPGERVVAKHRYQPGKGPANAKGGGEKREKGKDAPQPEVKSVTVADPRGLARDRRR